MTKQFINQIRRDFKRPSKNYNSLFIGHSTLKHTHTHNSKWLFFLRLEWCFSNRNILNKVQLEIFVWKRSQYPLNKYFPGSCRRHFAALEMRKGTGQKQSCFWIAWNMFLSFYSNSVFSLLKKLSYMCFYWKIAFKHYSKIIAYNILSSASY